MTENKQRHQLKTRNGYDLSEVRSSLQKMIRRSRTEHALFWAIEIYQSNFEMYLVYSLSTILAEEFNPLHRPDLYSALNSSMNLWASLLIERKKKKQRTELRPALGSWIVAMCKLKKNRCGDDAWAWVEIQRKNGLRLKIPSVALDEHCDIGRKMGRSYKFWVRQASQIHPAISAQGIELEKDYTAIVNKWYINNSPVNNESDWSEYNPNDPDAEIIEYSCLVDGDDEE